MTSTNAEAGPSTSGSRGGASAYHESSQFRSWRYSPEQLDSVREELNKKSMEVVKKNQELERVSQSTLFPLGFRHGQADPAESPDRAEPQPAQPRSGSYIPLSDR